MKDIENAGAVPRLTREINTFSCWKPILDCSNVWTSFENAPVTLCQTVGGKQLVSVSFTFMDAAPVAEIEGIIRSAGGSNAYRCPRRENAGSCVFHANAYRCPRVA